ncbi:MAG: hypothetical protein ACRC9R_08725 [Enterovibrio sp.]
MKLSAALVPSLFLIASLNLFAESPGEEGSMNMVFANAKIEPICGFTIDNNKAEFAYGEFGEPKNPARISAISNFDAYYGIRVEFDEGKQKKVGLKWIAKSDQGEKHEFLPNNDREFQPMNSATRVRNLEIDLFPRLTKIKNEINMEVGEYSSAATVTMKCQKEPISS